MDKLILGCGYLGQRVARRWLGAGHRVFAMTRSESRAAEFERAGIQPVVGDVCDPQTLDSLPTVATLLFAIGFDRTSGRSQREVYVDGLRNVLQAVAERVNQFIYVSSSSVYGQSAGEWVDETSLCQPVQTGGECCLAAEELVREFFPTINASRRANVLRLSGIYGPGRLLSRVTALRAGEPIAGRGDAWLNLIHVDDAAQAVEACEERGQPGQMYLVTDDRPISRAEYYGLLARLTESPTPTFDPETAAARGSGGINKRCRNERLRRGLQVSLVYPTINEGLPHALAAPSASLNLPAG